MGKKNDDKLNTLKEEKIQALEGRKPPHI